MVSGTACARRAAKLTAVLDGTRVFVVRNNAAGANDALHVFMMREVWAIATKKGVR